MTILSDVVERLRTLVFRRREERELDEELGFHLEMEARQHQRTGLDEGEAHRRTRAAFGGIERTKDDVRDARGTRLADDTIADLAYSLRTLRRSPRFTLVAVLTLAIGIGGTTAVFSAIDAVLLAPLPYAEPGQLVRLYQYVAGQPGEEGFSTPPHYREYRDRMGSLSEVAAAAAPGHRRLLPRAPRPPDARPPIRAR